VEEVKEMLIDRDKHIRFNKLLDYNPIQYIKQTASYTVCKLPSSIWWKTSCTQSTTCLLSSDWQFTFSKKIAF